MNSKYEITINVSFVYRAQRLAFKKHFRLPFAPFYGLCINDEDGGEVENQITLDNNDYVNTLITYSPKGEVFDVDIRNVF